MLFVMLQEVGGPLPRCFLHGHGGVSGHIRKAELDTQQSRTRVSSIVQPQISLWLSTVELFGYRFGDRGNLIVFVEYRFRNARYPPSGYGTIAVSIFYLITS